MKEILPKLIQWYNTTYGNNSTKSKHFYTNAGTTSNRQESPDRTVSNHTINKEFFFHRGTFICVKTWKSITKKAKLDKKQLFTKEFLTRCYFQQSNNIEINYL